MSSPKKNPLLRKKQNKRTAIISNLISLYSDPASSLFTIKHLLLLIIFIYSIHSQDTSMKKILNS